MKPPKLKLSPEQAEIKQWLDEMGIKKYTINPDLSVDVVGDVDISSKKLTSIPVQFGKVGGNFHCYDNNLTSLEHGPTHVGGDFWCSVNNLTSLEYCPTHVGGGFWCSDNKLTSLEHCPTHVGGDFYCNNNLTSLEHGPQTVGGSFFCNNNNNLTSLKDIHKQIKQINGAVKCRNTSIKSHILGVFFIKGLREIELDNKQVQSIINKHLKDGDVHQCQEELIKAGFAEYAKL